MGTYLTGSSLAGLQVFDWTPHCLADLKVHRPQSCQILTSVHPFRGGGKQRHWQSAQWETMVVVAERQRWQYRWRRTWGNGWWRWWKGWHRQGGRPGGRVRTVESSCSVYRAHPVEGWGDGVYQVISGDDDASRMMSCTT